MLDLISRFGRPLATFRYVNEAPMHVEKPSTVSSGPKYSQRPELIGDESGHFGATCERLLLATGSLMRCAKGNTPKAITLGAIVDEIRA